MPRSFGANLKEMSKRDRRDGADAPTDEGLREATHAPAPVDLPEVRHTGERDGQHTQVTSVLDLELWLDGRRFRAIEDEADDEDDDEAEQTDVMGRVMARGLISAEARTQFDRDSTVSGLLEEFSVTELLQMFAQRRRVGVLVVKGGHGVGRVWMEQGSLVGATWSAGAGLPPMAAIREIAKVQTGEFWFGPAHDPPPVEPVSRPLTHVLLDLEGDSDEDMDPPADPFNMPETDPTVPMLTSAARLEVITPLAPLLSDLATAELDVLQLILNHGTLGEAVARADRSEREVREAVGFLLVGGYIRLAES